MISFRFRVTAILISLAAVGCGRSYDVASSTSAAIDPSGLTVFIGQQIGTTRLVMVSSENTAQSATVCIRSAAQCPKVALLRVPTSGQRAIFSTDQLPVTVGLSLEFSVIDASGGERIRRVGIEANQPTPISGNSLWKAVMLAGDYQDDGQHVVAWDNARRDLTKLLIERGFDSRNFRQLSRDPEILQNDTQTRSANSQNLDAALASLNIQGNESCFVFMTSHGTQSEFYIEGDRGIAPTSFGQILDRHCGQRPTVAVVSACYSGIMINQNTSRNNRIIFTASSADRTSNGCQPGVQYTFFDECLVKGLQDQQVKSYNDLAESTKRCIDAKENPSNASNPQFFIGSEMQNLTIAGSAQAGASTLQTPGAGAGQQLPSNPSVGDVGAAQNASQLSETMNLRLVGPSGATDLRTAAGKSRYLLIDFSQPSCPYCIRFAETIESQDELFSSGVCKPITLVGRGQLDSWIRAAQSQGVNEAASHSYSLAEVSHGAAKGRLDGSNTSGPVATPTILLFDTHTNRVIRETSGALSANTLQQLLSPICR
jgi:hypothetical protein